jgi:hypothetical protein
MTKLLHFFFFKRALITGPLVVGHARLFLAVVKFEAPVIISPCN